MFFFFNDTATTEIYTLSLHDALPIWEPKSLTLQPADRAVVDRVCSAIATCVVLIVSGRPQVVTDQLGEMEDRKSTRLNSSHANISYAVFCLKKQKRQRK